MISKYPLSKQVLAIFALVCFIVIFYFPTCNSNYGGLSSDGLYFEDVNILIMGRCRSKSSSGEWSGCLFIGKMSYAGIGVFDTFLEKLNILVYNKTYANSFIKQLNKDVNMGNPEGIFFWGAWRQFSAGPIPPIVFVWCHAENLWISPKYSPII